MKSGVLAEGDAVELICRKWRAPTFIVPDADKNGTHTTVRLKPVIFIAALSNPFQVAIYLFEQ